MIKSFFIGLQFLTRLKLVNQTSWTMEDFGKSVIMFPFVGLVIGLAMYLFYYILTPFFPNSLLILLVVTFEFLFTGGLHADGFMDTCDGLFSGRERERKLEIMKDSRIGSNGVVGFVFLTLLKWQLLQFVPTQYITYVLIFLPFLSRYSLCLSITQYPYARPMGMGKAFADFAPKNTTTFTTVLAILLGLYFGWKYLILLGVTILINMILNRYITKQLGGVTGDTYGFVVENTEVLLLFVTYFM